MRAKSSFSSFSTLRRTFFLIWGALFSFSLFAQSSPLPDLGDIANSALPLFEEKRIGQELMQSIRRDSAFLDDVDSLFYLNQLGQRLRKTLPANTAFSFFLMNNPDINAFALPGGYIGVFSGLFLNAQTESELAGVLAHEMAHVAQRHIARRVYQNKQMLLAGLLGLGAAALSIPAGGANTAGAAIALTQGAMAQQELSFSRDLEREADRIGFETLKNARFDSQGMASFFQRLMQNKNEKNAIAYLQTHPLSSERLSDMQNRDALLPYQQIVSSDDFFIIRARLAVLQNHAQDAVKQFENYVKHQRYPNRAAAWYGLALAKMRAHRFQDALAHINQALSLLSNPYLQSLKAEILFQLNENDQALTLLKQTLSQNPQHFALQLHFAQALLSTQQFQQAFDFLRNINKKTPSPKSFQWQALAAQKLNQMAHYHAALGESALLEGLLPAAIEQFTQAENWAANDFFLASQIRSRLEFAKKIKQEQNKE